MRDQMPQTYALLLLFLSWAMPLLRHYAAPAGAGPLASFLFDRLRTRLPLTDRAPARRAMRVLLRVLYTPRYALVVNLVLAGLVSVGLSIVVAGLQAWMMGAPLLPALLPAVDEALAAFVKGMAANQVFYRLPKLSSELPAPTQAQAAAIDARLGAL